MQQLTWSGNSQILHYPAFVQFSRCPPALLQTPLHPHEWNGGTKRESYQGGVATPIPPNMDSKNQPKKVATVVKKVGISTMMEMICEEEVTVLHVDSSEEGLEKVEARATM